MGFPIVLNSGVDSVQADSTDFQNVDSVKFPSAEPLVNAIKIDESQDAPKCFKKFFQEKRKDLLERKNKRKEKRMLRNSI